jgi:hypothetical protein
MKPLILSFFGAILCYVLFFDKEKAQTPIEKINHIILPDIDACDHYQNSFNKFSNSFHCIESSSINPHDA